jgi:hypothetical protein
MVFQAESDLQTGAGTAAGSVCSGETAADNATALSAAEVAGVYEPHCVSQTMQQY